MIRKFLISDLIWVEPIAKAYNEWADMLRALDEAVAIVVIEPIALMAIHRDPRGAALAGTCGNGGIKAMAKLTKYLCALADACGTTLHGHWTPQTWQSNLAERNGFEMTGELYVRQPKGI